MTKTISTDIKKLTPPQILALREHLTGCVGAGILVTTASVASFRTMGDGDRRAYPTLDVDMTPPVVRRIVVGAKGRALAKGAEGAAKKLDAVLAKLDDETGAHVRVVTA